MVHVGMTDKDIGDPQQITGSKGNDVSKIQENGRGTIPNEFRR